MEREQRESAAVTLALALLGVTIGLWISAKAIVFDGMYDVVDAGMTLGAWFVARLIARGTDRRFQFGYWHIEPMLAVVNGAVLLLACFYGFVDGLGGVLEGGRTIEFGAGMVYAAASTIVSLGIFPIVRRSGQGLGSILLDLDARAWLLGGLLGAGLCASYDLDDRQGRRRRNPADRAAGPRRHGQPHRRRGHGAPRFCRAHLLCHQGRPARSSSRSA